jgi:uncharacterized membrane protein
VSYDCLLTIVIPQSLQEEVLDVLAGYPQWVSGFSLLRAEGFGVGAHLHSTIEQVRGRSERRLVQIVMNAADVDALLTALRGTFSSAEMAYWTVPLTAFGRFR